MLLFKINFLNTKIFLSIIEKVHLEIGALSKKLRELSGITQFFYKNVGNAFIS